MFSCICFYTNLTAPIPFTKIKLFLCKLLAFAHERTEIFIKTTWNQLQPRFHWSPSHKNTTVIRTICVCCEQTNLGSYFIRNKNHSIQKTNKQTNKQKQLLFLFITVCRITEVITSSPQGFIKSSVASYASQEYYVNVTWTPTSSNIETKLFCFTGLEDSG